MPNHNNLTPSEEKRIYEDVLRIDSHLPNGNYDRWLSENANRREKDAFVRGIWNDPQFTKALTMVENESDHKEDKASGPSLTLRLSYSLSAACILVCFLVIGVIRFSSTQEASIDTQVFETAVHEVQHKQLFDGSIADLSARTRLDVHFSEKERRLQLRQGEAQFSVKKDIHRPFVVETSQARMEALGTIFNVDQRGDITELSVFEGKVAISPLNDLQQQRIISAGERVTVAAGFSNGVTTFDPDSYKGWKDGWISVEKMPLSELLVKLNRFSQTELKSGDLTTGKLLVTGSFELKEMEKNIRILEALHGLTITRNNNHIVLKSAY